VASEDYFSPIYKDPAEDEDDEAGSLVDDRASDRDRQRITEPHSPSGKETVARQRAFFPAYSSAGGMGGMGGISFQSRDLAGWGNPQTTTTDATRGKSGEAGDIFDPRYWTSPLYRPMWLQGDMGWAPQQPTWEKKK
jgi:hypothetical protein